MTDWASTERSRASSAGGVVAKIAADGDGPLPAEARRSPAMTCRSVDLPAPFGPIRPTTLPGASVEIDGVEETPAADRDGDRRMPRTSA